MDELEKLKLENEQLRKQLAALQRTISNISTIYRHQWWQELQDVTEKLFRKMSYYEMIKSQDVEKPKRLGTEGN